MAPFREKGKEIPKEETGETAAEETYTHSQSQSPQYMTGERIPVQPTKASCPEDEDSVRIGITSTQPKSITSLFKGALTQDMPTVVHHP